ncbi:iron-sulfur cluster biosynthesis family protein [Lactococcus nasutitermitis]|uniref:Iron-sulfur cluster biosynthesis family protein n=1 Tax=Lactococcus nasutitermitis TaxID=1652957 RepID=A0ABV9JDL1_9LACT|nr:iron-sulfur cluster biosynthesis family protein [Lactococcus nasutitermitis]
MELKFDETVKNKLTDLTENKPADFVLDYDYSLSDDVAADACAIVDRLRLVALDKGKVPELFDGQISTALGTVYCKEWGKRFLDEDMSMRRTSTGLIEIMGAGGQLSPNAEIVDYRTK